MPRPKGSKNKTKTVKATVDFAAQLAEKYGWSSCMQNLSGKLRRGTFSYTEAVEIADILGYDIVWKKRKC